MASARPNRRRTILILLVLVSITLITLDTRGGDNGIGGRVRNAARDVLAPVQDGVDSLTQPIEDWWDGVTRVGRHQGREPQAATRAAAGARRGGDGTRRRSARSASSSGSPNLPFAGDLHGVNAQIILGSPGNFESTVVLEQGNRRRHRRRPAGGLRARPARPDRARVGQAATVLLLTDRDSGVSVRDAQTGVLGVINGRPDAEVQTLTSFQECRVKVGRRARHRGHRRRSVPAGHPGRAGDVGAAPSGGPPAARSPCELFADAGDHRVRARPRMAGAVIRAAAPRAAPRAAWSSCRRR